eukprot:scaffold241_cov340-Pavlova_lutheri.AAC.13
MDDPFESSTRPGSHRIAFPFPTGSLSGPCRTPVPFQSGFVTSNPSFRSAQQRAFACARFGLFRDAERLPSAPKA